MATVLCLKLEPCGKLQALRWGGVGGRCRCRCRCRFMEEQIFFKEEEMTVLNEKGTTAQCVFSEMKKKMRMAF